MKTNIQQARRGFTLVELLVVIVIIAALAGLAVPQVIKMKKKGDVAEAINNAKQLGLALTSFDSDIGGYPDDASKAELTKRAGGTTKYSTLSGTKSNDYFRQLFEAGTADSEQPFYAKSTYGKIKPDDSFQDDATCLAAKECGFGYIMKDATTSITVSGSRPVAAAPMEAADSAGKMEIDPFDGKAVVLFTDNSARQLPINRTTFFATLPNGKGILEEGADTVWGDVAAAPVILPPLDQ